jgi:HK97 gp10 family phage protein
MPVSAANGFKIEGLEELQKTLDEVVPNVAFNLLRATTLAVSQKVAKRVRAAAPHGGDGTLKKAIKAKRGNPRNNKGRPFADVEVEHGKGVANDAFYWRFVEYGTAAHEQPKRGITHPGSPETGFIRKSVAAARPEMGQILNDEFGKKFARLIEAQKKKAAKRKGR